MTPASLRVGITLLALALVVPASADAQLLATFGGGAGFGTVEISGDDEQEIVDVSGLFKGGFPLFGVSYPSLYVTTNGLVSLGGPRTMAPGSPFPVSGRPILAAWSTDMLTDGTTGTPGGNLTYVHAESGRVVVTWYLARPRTASPSELEVSAQMILTATTGATVMELRYASCEWTQTRATALHAQVGVSRGDDAPLDVLLLPGSGTPSVANLCTGSNVTPPEQGVWRVVLPSTGILPMCGNFLRETGETCDDGNLTEGDGCSASCTSATSVCGNGVIEAGEECDDGDTMPRDGCDELCQSEGPVETCGNGTMDPDEACDDGNFSSTDGCVLCETARCGDGFVWQDVEDCDDGNTVGGDACPADCGGGVGPVDGGASDGGRPPRGYTLEGGGCQCLLGQGTRGSAGGFTALAVLVAIAVRGRRRR